jgi:hypothetical protein
LISKVTTLLSPDQIRRLRFARLLMNQAHDHARVDFDARNAACLTSLQDAVETLLLIVAEKVDATLPARPDFDKYFDVPLSFHPAATRVLGLVTPRSVG